MMLAGMAGKAQYKFVTHDMRMGVPHPGYPFYLDRYIWWNDSTVSLLNFDERDTVKTLQIQMSFLLHDDLETHRRLDSLIFEMRQVKYVASPSE